MNSKKASELIEEALQKALAGFDESENGDLVVDWAIVAYVANSDDEKRGGCLTLYSNGEMPNYRAKGLFHEALDNLGMSGFLDAITDE